MQEYNIEKKYMNSIKGFIVYLKVKLREREDRK